MVNSYHAGAAGTVTVAATVIPLASISGQRTSNRTLQVGDQVLVMQMQDSTNAARGGLHEYASIISIAGNNITLNRPLTNFYVQDVGAAPIRVRTYQVVYVPQCSSASVPAANTVSADRWTINTANGQGTGGIVALDVAGSLAINGTITVAGAGFRGGAGVNGTGNRAGGLFSDLNYSFDTAAANGALKGEGILGTPRLVFAGTTALVNYFALSGQGYAAGAAGQAAQSNAAGGGNDGEPVAGGNQYNSGGGGGANAGAGGQGGRSWSQNNDAGGRGGNAITNSSTRLVMGGGGGAGSSNNNGVANAITAGNWPPSASSPARSVPPTTGTANGAAGAISSSGASGGGLVLIRAGELVANSGNVIADGYTAFNNSGGSESGGGGGAGGSVYINALSGTGAGLNISAQGGGGGYSNYYDHGPGGGGGGGYIQTSLAAAATNVSGGTLGYDGCCGGVQGNSSPKAYGSVVGSDGAIAAIAAPTGNASGAQCLPQLSVVKTTSTPTRTVPTQTTAQYIVRISNAATAGTAYGVSLQDILPAPFGLATVATTANATYTGTLSAGPQPTTANQSGNTNTAIFGVAGGTNANSYTLGSGGVVTLTFTVNINTTTVPQTFQNSASTTFTDPTRNTGGTAAAGGNPSVSPGGAYTSGVAVAGSNYSSASSTGEDVRLVGSVNLAITKTNGTSPLVAGQTTSYTVTVSNVSPSIALINGIVQDSPTAGLNCTSVTCTNNGSSAICPAPYNPGPAAFTSLSTGLIIPVLPTNSSLSFIVTCGVTATGQ